MCVTTNSACDCLIADCYGERPSVAGSQIVAIQETSCPSGENETLVYLFAQPKIADYERRMRILGGWEPSDDLERSINN